MYGAGAGGAAGGAVGYDETHQAGYPDESQLSASDRESLHSAREDLQEAQAEYNAESDPSSSDREELEEAQEEYEEEVEEAYDD